MTTDISHARWSRLESRIGLIVQRTVGIGMVLTVLLVLVRPHDPNIDYQQGWVIAGLVVALAAAAALTVLARRGGWLRAHARAAEPRTTWAVAVAVSVAGGVVGVLIARLLRYSYGWDAAVVTDFSRRLSSDGTLSAYAQDYLSRYPNNVALVAMMNVARSLGGGADAGMYDWYLIANGFSLAVVLLLCFTLVRMLRGAAAAFVTQAVVFVLVGCSPWMAVPYTDFPAMPFVTGAVVLAVAATRTHRTRLRIGLVVAAFASTAVAVVLKSTPATTAAAFLLCGLLFAIGSSSPRRARLAVLGTVGAIVFALTTVGAMAISDDVSHVPGAALDASRTPPLTWWLANGLTTTRSISGRPYYGAYNPEMVNDSRTLSGDRLHTWSDQRLRQQLAALGPTGTAAFELRKQGFNWGDGMFFAWGEGYDFQAKRLKVHDRLARAVQSFQHVSGDHYLLRASLTNGLWLALLLWAGVGLVRARYRRDVLVMVLTILGIAVFTLVFQGRSRYLFAYVPVIIALAATVDPLRTSSPTPSRRQDARAPVAPAAPMAR